MFQAGSMQAVLWQHEGDPASSVPLRVSLHVAGRRNVRSEPELTLLTSDQVEQAMVALESAHRFVRRSNGTEVLPEELFVTAADLLTGEAT